MREVLYARLGGRVQRCHIIPHSGSYSVAEHTWGAMMLLLQLFPDSYDKLSRFLLVHDVPEFVTGDTPAPVKRYSPEIAAAIRKMEVDVVAELMLPSDQGLSENERTVLKNCDHLELYIWACEQLCAGNLFARGLLKELDVYFSEDTLLPPAQCVWHVLRDNPEKAVVTSNGIVRRLEKGK